MGKKELNQQTQFFFHWVDRNMMTHCEQGMHVSTHKNEQIVVMAMIGIVIKCERIRIFLPVSQQLLASQTLHGIGVGHSQEI